ncbi:cadherin domain-containing protein [Chondrinema litorale]|uniref:cadherin domain-containing protein n=1 Tax=Chondrinema litorale TaxID=2994555 RepID=UPI002543202C|nr:cadherin domain-containing protein [Chondrinema litorale]UZR96324.1 cadherin domain-containing protein [Chondrinema litorale]
MKKPIIKSIALFSLGLTLFFSCQKDDEPEPQINNAPTIKDQSFDASEDIADSVIIGKLVADDIDDDISNFEITQNSSQSLSAGTGSGQLSLDDILFEINKNGELKLVDGKQLDYEKKTKHDLIVEVSDGELSTAANITVNVQDVAENGKPVIDAQSFTIAENSPLGSTVGTVIASDPDGDDLVYFWSSGQETNPALSTFKLSGNQIKTIDINDHQGVLNYEKKDSYTVDVTVGDGKLSKRGTITITITDVNDAPTFDSNLITTLTAPEDTGETEDIGNFTATDEDGDQLSFSLKNDTDDLFEIKASGRLELQSGKSLDFETKTSHTLTVVVTDTEGATDELDITINVTDVDDIPLTGIMVSTLAGSTSGYLNGKGAGAKFFMPQGLILNNNGDLIVADRENQMTRTVTLSGEASFHAGAMGSLIKNPQDVIQDNDGNYYVSDWVQEVIFKLTPKTTLNGYDITIFAGQRGKAGFADGTSSIAQFFNPSGMALAANGDLYVADRDNNKIRKITPSGVVSTFAGGGSSGDNDGTGINASFTQPTDIDFDSNGDLIVVDYGNHKIRKITPSGVVTTIAGSTQGDLDGNGTNAQFNYPYQLTIDQQDNIYLTDMMNRKLKKVSATGEVTTIAGGGYVESDGDASVASFSAVHGVQIDNTGYNLYLTTNKTIRKISFPE